MDLFYWRYRLTPRGRLNALSSAGPREGALIRVLDGVADVHPWVELGDLPLDGQLASLSRGVTTPLTSASLRFAKIDGGARRRGVSLFDGLQIPPSHWPYGGGAVPPGFDTVKVKADANIDVDELRALARYKLRLDFNATLDAQQFGRFATSLPSEFRDAIDYVEDPCPYDPTTWSELRRTTGLRLALDRLVAEEGVDVLVVKPAVQEVPQISSREMVITSYMDHPVGQFAAAYVAAQQTARVAVCGLMTHVLYEADEFLDSVRCEGAQLLPPPGTGIGFDDLLERLPWKRL